MKRILFITQYTPTKDNYGGPSALMFHLLKNRPPEHELLVLSTNKNSVPINVIKKSSDTLKAPIHIIPKSVYNSIITSNKLNKVLKFIFRLKLPCDCYYSLSTKTLSQIKSYNPHLIFIYPHNNITIAKQLRNYNIVVCGPDCSSLHYSRLLKDSYCFTHGLIKDTITKYYHRLIMEKEWGKINNTIIYLVGYADTKYFNIINNKEKAFFFPHPHYELVDKTISLQHNTLNVIITGKYDLYTYSDITNLTRGLINFSSHLIIKNNYHFTFLGRNWEMIVNKLKNAGYNVNHVEWVDNYVDFIAKYDIQIFPISVGSGTKGKVLDSLSTGILSIGSRYAFENIAIKDHESCIIYDDIKEVPTILKDILSKRDLYEAIAARGKASVRSKHSPSYIINMILQFATTKKYHINLHDYYKYKHI